jgi:hypothetical protein
MQYFFITSNGNLINYSQKMAVMPITFELLFNYIVHFFIQTTVWIFSHSKCITDCNTFRKNMSSSSVYCPHSTYWIFLLNLSNSLWNLLFMLEFYFSSDFILNKIRTLPSTRRFLYTMYHIRFYWYAICICPMYTIKVNNLLTPPN